MVDEVQGVIGRIQEKYISSGRLALFNEASTKATAIEPILDELGWDVADPDEVQREYSVGGGLVDYALCYNDTLKVFVEAKKGGEPLVNHQAQLLNYSFRKGVKTAALTNGKTWWFYLPLQEGSWEQRKIETVELDEQDKTEITQKLIDLLSKKNVISGKAEQNAKDLHEKHQISKTFPKAWNQLVSEPDSFIVDLLEEKTRELCGHKPDRVEVEQFLSVNLRQIKIMLSAGMSPPDSPPEPDDLPKPPANAVAGKKLAAFTFNGDRYKVNSWTAMLIELCQIVHSNHPDRFHEVMHITIGAGGKPFFKTADYLLGNPHDAYRWSKINETDLIVITHGGRKNIEPRAKRLIEYFEYEKNVLSFETSE